jgi:hypothetical protein
LRGKSRRSWMYTTAASANSPCSVSSAPSVSRGEMSHLHSGSAPQAERQQQRCAFKNHSLGGGLRTTATRHGTAVAAAAAATAAAAAAAAAVLTAATVLQLLQLMMQLMLLLMLLMLLMLLCYCFQAITNPCGSSYGKASNSWTAVRAEANAPFGPCASPSGGRRQRPKPRDRRSSRGGGPVGKSRYGRRTGGEAKLWTRRKRKKGESRRQQASVSLSRRRSVMQVK